MGETREECPVHRDRRARRSESRREGEASTERYQSLHWISALCSETSREVVAKSVATKSVHRVYHSRAQCSTRKGGIWNRPPSSEPEPGETGLVQTVCAPAR